MSDDLEERGSRLERAMFGEQGSDDDEPSDESDGSDDEPSATASVSRETARTDTEDVDRAEVVEETEEAELIEETEEPEETGDSREMEDTLDAGETNEAVEVERTSAMTEEQSSAASPTESERSTGGGSRPLVEETHDLHMYLPESRYQDLVGLYKVLDGEYYRKEGTDLEKNRQYFDAVIQVALDHEAEIRDQLGL